MSINDELLFICTFSGGGEDWVLLAMDLVMMQTCCIVDCFLFDIFVCVCFNQISLYL